MKKQPRRLRLSRETINRLDSTTLEWAEGAGMASSQACCPGTTAITGNYCVTVQNPIR